MAIFNLIFNFAEAVARQPLFYTLWARGTSTLLFNALSNGSSEKKILQCSEAVDPDFGFSTLSEQYNFSQKNYFWAFLHFFWEICVMHYGSNQTIDLESNTWQDYAKNIEMSQKMAILNIKSKNFTKAKLTVFNSHLLELVCFMISCVLRGDLI